MALPSTASERAAAAILIINIILYNTKNLNILNNRNNAAQIHIDL
jgi:hypothetical protein